MEEEFIGRSRVFREAALPGAHLQLRNQAYVKVVSTHHNDHLPFEADRQQLLQIVRRYVRQWTALQGTAVDSGLLNALEQDDSMRISNPDRLYVVPDPLILKCTACHRLQGYAGRGTSLERQREWIRRIGRGRNPMRIPCPNAGCSGHMLQLPYIAIHRCGYAGPLTIPHASMRVQNLGFADKGGAFFHNAFIDLDSGSEVDHALQGQCRHCHTASPDSEKTHLKGSPVKNAAAFYPHTVQYVCLSKSSGSLVSTLLTLNETSPTHPVASATREIVITALLYPEKRAGLFNQLQRWLNDTTTPGEQEDLASLTAQRDELCKALALYESLLAHNPMMASAIELTQDKINNLEERLARQRPPAGGAESRFLSHGVTLGLASQRRVYEALFLGHDFSVLKRQKDAEHQAALFKQFGIFNIHHISDINIVLAGIGYTREMSRPAEDGQDNAIALNLMGYQEEGDHQEASRRHVYALSARTEALYIQLDPCQVLRWCVDAAHWDNPGQTILGDPALAKAHLIEHSAVLQADRADSVQVMRQVPLQNSAPYHLLHSISHALLSAIQRPSGYDEKSVLEYLIPADLGVILYVSSVQNYTAGGLLSLYLHGLSEWLTDARRQTLQCTFDPICSDRGGSCSGCLQTPIGCESFNRGLSRSYLQGGAASDELTVTSGYWSD